MKNVWKKGIPALMAIGLLAGCAQRYTLTNQTFVFELGDDVFANPSLYIETPEKVDTSRLSVEPQSPGITISDNRFVSVSLDYLGVGEYDFAMVEGHSKTPFVIKIKDTKAPVLAQSPAELTVPWGTDVNWQDVYGACDLSGVYYDVPVDALWSVGTKDIEIRIRDRFGNSVTKTLHLTVTS